MKILLSHYFIDIRAKPETLSEIELWLNSIGVQTRYVKKGEGLRVTARQNTLYEIILKLSFDNEIEVI